MDLAINEKFYKNHLLHNFRPTDTMASTIDDIFIKIGAFHRYQWYLLIVVGYAEVSLSSFPAMIVAFITAEPDWKCVDGYMNNAERSLDFCRRLYIHCYRGSHL
jgi:hypothetical protein